MKKTKEPILHLPVKTEYFLEIKSGEKEFEFRLYNKYWQKRLEGKKYRKIKVTKGYPKNTDYDRIVERPYLGFDVREIVHKHFGSEPVMVFAIRVN
ncbi:ASCH domain-containing protein [Vibrio aestuarianus]|uniref:RNA-binding protein n=1 Tax=Vibrio aestuarianus TaxID=28171 RepID=A0ABN8TU44_9VIBR|nr:ASCH domain-containing protein [Vibrio aestuarianus]MDE1213784.1 ASCH domain-containing protein [Vibrio aestuarianus]MDE1217241.1 ASCH domain-containing protein [Vibrio aestuarianus]MDE1256982.1 ASCH domain-containing protein [Vibrio aestuarianus]MDE1260782.1 ASCH domain-containing protein [Vibrio aestuarianus]MDE1267578.1 ASCH domain-containing protein [Vibrio aestuarianus]